MKDWVKDYLSKYKLLNETLEYEEEVTKHEINISDDISNDSIGISSDGIRYPKNLVLKYLSDNNIPFTQESIDMVAKKYSLSEDNKIISYEKIKKEIVKNEADDISDEDLNTFLQLKTLEKLNHMQKSDYFMDYKVDVIFDNRDGSTNINGLTKSLKTFSELGWKVKNIFANEIGVNSSSFGIGGASAGTNATIDQIIIIYERPIWINDSNAKKLKEDILKNNIF